MGLSITEALLAALLFALPPSPNAWAVKPCPDIVQDVRSILDSYANPEKIRSLRMEEANAWNDYTHAMSSLRNANQLYEYAMFIHGAHQAQVKYCDAHNTLAKLGLTKYELIPMEKSYYGEDVGKSIEHIKLQDWAKKPPIRYLNMMETETLRVQQKQGMLVLPNGNSLNGLQKAEYVMDSSGGIFVLDKRDPRFSMQDKKVPDLKHSSILRGEPVAAAGEISFDEQGRITEITRRSGHYPEGPKYLEQFLSRLREMGVDLSHAQITNGF